MCALNEYMLLSYVNKLNTIKFYLWKIYVEADYSFKPNAVSLFSICVLTCHYSLWKLYLHTKWKIQSCLKKDTTWNIVNCCQNICIIKISLDNNFSLFILKCQYSKLKLNSGVINVSLRSVTDNMAFRLLKMGTPLFGTWDL